MSLIDLTAIHLALQFSTTLVQDMKRWQLILLFVSTHYPVSFLFVYLHKVSYEASILS